MATETAYTKSMAIDFSGSIVPSYLKKEIQQSPDIYHAVSRIMLVGDVVSIVFKDALDAVEVVALSAVIAAHTGIKLDTTPMVKIEGNVKAESVATVGSRKNFVSHNFTDKTTWYTDAARVVDEVITDSGDGLTFNTIHKPIVSATRGKIFGEHAISDAEDHSYALACTVDGAAVSEKDKHTDVGNYSVDYANGKVTFDVSQAGKQVKLTYHKVQSSRFTIKPTSGKKITLKNVETQFSQDYNLTDTIIFQPRAIVELVAPAMAVSNGGPVPDGTLIDIASPTIYNTEDDFIRESNGAFPVIFKSTNPDAAGNWRMNKKDRQGYPWEYAAGIILSSSLGMQIDIYLEHDTPYGGEEATATLYGLSEDE